MDYKTEYWKKCIEVERLKREALFREIIDYVHYQGEIQDAEYWEKELENFLAECN